MTMKNTPADDAVTARALDNAQGMIRSIVERVEVVEAEIRDKQGDRKDIYAEARGNGLDVAALKKLVALRRMDPDKRAESEAILDMYRASIGL